MGIISNHEEVIRCLIEVYYAGHMSGNIKTTQVALARFIARTEILGYLVDGEYRPLNLSTIINYISTIINEDKNSANPLSKTKKKPYKK